MTATTKQIKDITAFIPAGRDNAIKADELTAILNTNKRNVTQAIETARRNGAPIAAAHEPPAGYYMATTKAEMYAYCERLEHHINEIKTTLISCTLSALTLPNDE